MGNRLAMALIHSIRPSDRFSSHSRSAVRVANSSMIRIRLADRCGSRILRCTACTGSSAVASACIGAPGAPMSNGVTVPSSWKTIVAVRLEEKSSTRSMASCTASHPQTA